MNTKFLDDLLKQAAVTSEHAKNMLDGMQGVIDEAIKAAPDEEKDKIQDVKVLTQRAMAMAREGNAEGINELIKGFTDGRKNNK